MIKENDIVLLEFNTIFNWLPYLYYEKNSLKVNMLKVEVLNVPSNVGEFFVFKELETGTIFYQNPLDSNLVRIYKLEE